MPCVDAWFDPVSQSFFKAANPLIKASQAQSPYGYQHPVLQPRPTGRARADASSCLPVSPPRPVPVGPQCLCLQTRGCRPRTGHHFRVLTAVLTYRKWEIQVRTQHHEDLPFRPLLEQTVLIWVPLEVKQASLVSQTVKGLPAMQETQIWSLGWEGSTEKGMTTHSNILAWRIPRTEEPSGLQSSSVQFSHSVMSNSLRLHGLQHARLPCLSPTPGAYSNSCLLSQWCHSTIASSVVPFSSCLQSFPASGSFPVSQFFASGGQSFGVSASASVLPMNIQDWFPLGWTSLISLQSKGLSRIFSSTTVQKHQFFSAELSL